jgi:hypothetical protein
MRPSKISEKKLLEVWRETQKLPASPSLRGVPFRDMKEGDNAMLLTPIHQGKRLIFAEVENSP